MTANYGQYDKAALVALVAMAYSVMYCCAFNLFIYSHNAKSVYLCVYMCMLTYLTHQYRVTGSSLNTVQSIQSNGRKWFLNTSRIRTERQRT